MIINLSPEQLRKCKNLAVARHDAKAATFRNRTTKIFRNKAKDDLAIATGLDVQYMAHFIGVLGEMAWAIHSGQELDTQIYAVRDNGEDFPGVEIKAITYSGLGEPELKIPQKEYDTRTDVQLYVLVRINTTEPEEVEILGSIDRDVFEALSEQKQYGPNKPINYVVPLSMMAEV